MLEIQLRSDQFALLYELTRMFPDLIFTFKTDMTKEYRATLKDGSEGLRQLNYLHTHGIGYINVETRRERLVKAFFQDVEIWGQPVKRVRFQRAPGKKFEHIATLVTEAEGLDLHFPPQWNPPTEDVAHQYDGWICVYEANGFICAALAARDGKEEGLIRRTKTLAEMEEWLKTQQLLPVIRLPRSLGIFALYRPLEKTANG